MSQIMAFEELVTVTAAVYLTDSAESRVGRFKKCHLIRMILQITWVCVAPLLNSLCFHM